MHPELDQSRPTLGRIKENGSCIGGRLWGLGGLAGRAGEHGITHSRQLRLRGAESRTCRIPLKKTSKAIRTILRLQGLNALGDITVIDVATVDIHEMPDGRGLVASGFVGGGKFIVQGDAGFAVDGWNLQGLVIPADGGFGHSFFEETLRQPGVSLHDLREGMSVIKGLASRLEFS